MLHVRHIVLLGLLFAAACDKETPDKTEPVDTGDTVTVPDTDPDECTEETFYRDADGDTFGTPDDSTEACEAPDGYVSDATDCDDADAAIHPSAEEVCDDADVDEDCDGLIDDEDDSVGEDGRRLWHRDADGDGYGGADVLVACDVPGEGSWVEADGSDCDDAEVTTHPGAEELCEDEVDNDCDSDINEGCVLDDLGDASVIISGSGDGFGYRVAGGDLTGDGIDDLVVGAYISGSGYEGAALVFAGPLSGAVSASDAVGTISGTEGEGALGLSVETTEDLDGDGLSDLLLGAPGLGGSSARINGFAYLVTGVPTGTLSLPGDAYATFEGAELGANAGSYADDIGDVNGDGDIDIVIGAEQAHDVTLLVGQVYLMRGPVSGDYDLSTDADIILYPDEWAGGIADDMPSGDLTGDGLDDIILPANTSSPSGIVNGVVFVVSDPSGDVVLEDDADAWVTGAASYLGFGWTAVVADMTGDGYDDLVASDGTTPGTTYLIEGPISGTATTTADALSTYTGLGSYFMDRSGYTLEQVDLNHDGAADLAIGSPHLDYTAAGPGTVHVFYGPLSVGAHSLTAADVDLEGVAPDALGLELSNIGDVTDDGQEELAAVSIYRGGGDGMIWILE